MAKPSNPLIGTTTKSIGGVTFSTWKGIAVMKTKVTKPKNPKTPKQVAQRKRLTRCVEIFQKASAVLKAGFKSLAIKKSEYNAFITKNIATIIASDGTFDYAKLFISSGALETTPITSVAYNTSSRVVTISFDKTKLSGGRALTDKIVAFCGEVDTGKTKFLQVVGSVDTRTRNDGTATLTMPVALQSGAKVQCYLGFSDAKDLKQSTSVYKETA